MYMSETEYVRFPCLLMELRDNGKLEYQLPDDAFGFMNFIKEDETNEED